MLSLAIMTVALVAGECPTCNARHYLPWYEALPKAIVGCRGTYCASCNRPLADWAPQFNYRNDFNYPWSQEPCAMYVHRAPPYGLEREMVPEEGSPEAIPTPPALPTAAKLRQPKSVPLTVTRPKPRIIQGTPRDVRQR